MPPIWMKTLKVKLLDLGGQGKVTPFSNLISHWQPYWQFKDDSCQSFGIKMFLDVPLRFNDPMDIVFHKDISFQFKFLYQFLSHKYVDSLKMISQLFIPTLVIYSSLTLVSKLQFINNPLFQFWTAFPVKMHKVKLLKN